MSLRPAPEKQTPEVVAAVLARESDELPLSTAIGLVGAVDLAPDEAARLLGERLAADDDPAVRRSAARALARVAGAGAIPQLTEALGDEHAEVVADAAVALGFVGGPDELEPLAAALERSGKEGWTAERVRFAGVLVAHRHGLKEPAAEVPDPADRVPVDDAEPLPMATADTGAEHESVREALRRLGQDLMPVAEAVDAITCGPRVLTLAWNAEALGAGLGRLADQPALLGAVLSESQTSGRLHPSFLILTAPGGEGIDLLVCRPTGQALYRGSARLEGDALRGEVWSLDRPGVAPIEVRGALADRLLEAEGVSASRVFEKRQSTPEPLTA